MFVFFCLWGKVLFSCGMSVFRLRQFEVWQEFSPAKVGTDGFLLGAWVKPSVGGRILDVGTGTGIIALQLAQRCPETRIEAVERHPGACRDAERNFRNSPWAERLRLHSGDFLEVELKAGFDLIVSNPPFFEPGADSPDVDRRSWRSQSQLSLADLVAKAAALLGDTGRLALVLPSDLDEQIWALAEQHALFPERQTVVRPLPDKPPHRSLWEFGRRRGPLEVKEMAIHRSRLKRHDCTEDYVRLCRDFYPWME